MFKLLICVLFVFTINTCLFSNPVISDITYSEIEMSSVKISWRTDVPADSKIRWMVSDSNYQVISYTDSVFSQTLDTLHSITLTFLNPFTLYNYNITSSCSTGSTTSANQMFATKSTNEGTIKIYFNKSVDTTVSNGVIAEGNVNLAYTLLNRIAYSGYYIDVATSHFEDAYDLTAALLKAKRDGVVIRFIYDGKQNSKWIDTLIAHGIKVVKRNYDNTGTHHLNTNFWIFDSRCTCSGGNIFVWTSSAQINDTSLLYDKNSAVEINDRTLAYIYTREFDEMWGAFGDNPDTSKSKFGTKKADNIPHIVNLNGVYTEVYFAPSDSVHLQTKKLFNKSASSVLFGTYDFNSQLLFDALFQLRNTRNIRGIFDNSKLNSNFFNSMKVWSDVWTDTSAGKFYHKYIITDPLLNNSYSKVLMGSSDWTTESNLYNDENILIFHSPTIANQYYQEFHQRYKEVSGHVVSINNISNEVPKGFYLYQNYPNPFNSQTVIRFSIPNTTDVKLDIYNILGKKVVNLVNAKYKTGTYEVNFNGSALSSGIYYYMLTGSNFIETKKFVIVK